MISFLTILSEEIRKQFYWQESMPQDEAQKCLQRAWNWAVGEFRGSWIGTPEMTMFNRTLAIINVVEKRPFLKMVVDSCPAYMYSLESLREDLTRTATWANNTAQAAAIRSGQLRPDYDAFLKDGSVVPRVDLSHLEPIKGWDDLDLDELLLEDDDEEDIWPELRADISEVEALGPVPFYELDELLEF